MKPIYEVYINLIGYSDSSEVSGKFLQGKQ